MKKSFAILYVVLSIILITSCSDEKQPELKIENLDAFAYYVEDYWELNASVIVSGFKINETGGERSVKLSYYIDLISPSGELLEEVDYGMVDEILEDDAEDVKIDIQLFVDEGFETGQYKFLLYVNDDLSTSQASDTTTFVLEGNQMAGQE